MQQSLGYDAGPEALKTIEAKLRQMQATGANITPEMMQGIYSSVLEVGAEKAVRRDEALAAEKAKAYSESETTKRFDRAMDARESQGIGNAIGNVALYGGRYAAKKGWLDGMNPFAEKTPGGTTTPEPLKTTGGQEVIPNTGTPGFGTKPTLMQNGNSLAGYGNAENMASLELGPSTLPGPVTSPPVAAGQFAGMPSEFLGATEAPISVAETAPMATEAVGEIGTETLAETGGQAVGSLGASSYMGPAGAGAFGSGLLKTAGVRDDVGKVLLLGEGGENEQDIMGGVAGGAAAGAAAGTWVFPGIGTAVGGIIGGIVGGVSAAFDDLF